MKKGGPNSREQIICMYCGIWFSAIRKNPTIGRDGRGLGLGKFCSGLCHKKYVKLDHWDVLVNVGKYKFIATDSGIRELGG